MVSLSTGVLVMKDEDKESLIYWMISFAFVFLAVQALCNVGELL